MRGLLLWATVGDLEAFVGDGFEPSLLEDASLFKEMLDGRWATFLVAGAVCLNAGGGSLGFPLVLVACGVPRGFVGEPSGADGAALALSVFLVTRWGECSNDEPFRIFPSSGVSSAVNLPIGGPPTSVTAFSGCREANFFPNSVSFP